MINYFGNDVRENLAAYGSAWTMFLTDTDVLTSHSDLLAHSMNVIPMTITTSPNFSWVTSRSVFATHLPHVDQDNGIVNHIAEITSPIVVSVLSALKTITLQNGAAGIVMSTPISLSVVQSAQRFYIEVLPTASITVSNGVDSVLVTATGYYDLAGTNFTISGTGTLNKLRFFTNTKSIGISNFSHAILVPNNAADLPWEDVPYFAVDLSDGKMILSRRTITRNERVTVRAGQFTPDQVTETV